MTCFYKDRGILAASAQAALSWPYGPIHLEPLRPMLQYPQGTYRPLACLLHAAVEQIEV